MENELRIGTIEQGPGPFKIITGAHGKQDWLQIRRQGICGSDFAGIMGQSPWTSPATVYAEKLGLLPETPSTEPMYWGTALEDAIADRYQEDTGIRLRSLPKWSVAVHEEFPWWFGTPDRLAATVPDLGVEIKTARTGDGWGEPGTDEIPDHYLIQAASYMAVTKRPRWDVAVLIGGQDYRVYHLHESPDLTEALRLAGERFWHNHVLPQVPPEMDGTQGCTDMLKKLYPRSSGTALLQPTEDQRIYAKQIAHWRTVVEHAEKEEAAWVNALKAQLGEAPGLDFGPAGKITWKQNSDSHGIDYKRFYEFIMRDGNPLGCLRAHQDDVGGPGTWEGFLASFRNTKPGARPFLFKVEGDKL